MTEMHHPIRLLLVEDDDLDQSLFDRVLARTDVADANVSKVGDLAVALRHLETQYVDVVLLDMDLPDSHGVATIERLRRYSASVPILVFLEDNNERKGMEAIGHGADDYLIKDRYTPYQLAKSIRNALKRYQAQRAYQESQREYRVLFENSSEGIIAVDPQTLRFRYANPAICRMLGYSQEELLGLRLPQIHPDTAVEHVVSEIQAISAEKKAVAAEVPFLTRDGGVLYMEVNSVATQIDGRTVVVGFMRDVTDRKEAEEALRQKVDDLERFKALTVNRELRMIELKQEVNAMLDRAGEAERYKIVD